MVWERDGAVKGDCPGGAPAFPGKNGTEGREAKSSFGWWSVVVGP